MSTAMPNSGSPMRARGTVGGGARALPAGDDQEDDEEYVFDVSPAEIEQPNV